MSEPDQSSIMRAIVIAQNASKEEDLDQQSKETLGIAICAIWSRIQAQPDSYLLTNLEAKVFNYHRSLFQGDERARRAMARYWENTHGANGINGR